jgi:hypothetical protein
MPTIRRSRRPQRRLLAGGIACAAVLFPVGVLVVLLGAADDEPGTDPSPEVTPSVPLSPAPALGPTDSIGDGHWDIAAQAELATRPMARLPEAVAWPHALSEATAGTPITLPPAVGTTGAVPSGFPATPEGALAQLAALTRVGLEGGDPQRYRLAYESVALPAAPAVETARLYRDLVRVRGRVAGLPRTGPVPGLVFTWTPTSGLVKGTTDGGRYAVVCVLGELVTGIHGQSVASGAGDCQAMRRTGDQWRISPGPAVAPAPLAWPGSAEAVRAGYREVR